MELRSNIAYSDKTRITTNVNLTLGEESYPTEFFDTYGRKANRPIPNTLGWSWSVVVTCAQCDRKLRWVPRRDRLPAPRPLCSQECLDQYNASERNER